MVLVVGGVTYNNLHDIINIHTNLSCFNHTWLPLGDTVDMPKMLAHSYSRISIPNIQRKYPFGNIPSATAYFRDNFQ